MKDSQMDKNNAKNRCPEEELRKIAPYLMRFAIKAHTLMEIEHSDKLIDLIVDSAGDIYAYAHGESLPNAQTMQPEPKNNGWRVI